MGPEILLANEAQAPSTTYFREGPESFLLAIRGVPDIKSGPVSGRTSDEIRPDKCLSK